LMMNGRHRAGAAALWPKWVVIIFLVSAFASSRVLAHSEQGAAIDFWGGFTHPIFGLDHVVAMVAVGLWGAFLGPPAIWLLPVVFPLVMAVAGAYGVLGLPLHGVEIGIALSAIMLGAMVAGAVVWSAPSRSSTATPTASSCRSERMRSRFPWASSSPPACCMSAASPSEHCRIGLPAALPCG
jgi:HupE / UreJ protein